MLTVSLYELALTNAVLNLPLLWHITLHLRSQRNNLKKKSTTIINKEVANQLTQQLP